MTDFADPAFFGDHWAHVYDEGIAGSPDPGPAPAVEFLAGLAGTGRVLELAIGTGRVALPLAERGVAVEGIEASAAMVSQLRAKPGGDQIGVVIGDMADVPAQGPFQLVYLVFNTLFNLVSAQRQADCFRNVARVLEPGGAFVIECFVPDPAAYDGVHTLGVTEDSATIEVYQHDAAAQRFHTQKITFTSQGIRMLPLVMRYCWPSELDLMASQAGLELRERYADWDRRPFVSGSPSHISVYRPATAELA